MYEFYLKITQNPYYFALFVLLAVWSLILKGIALWKSARKGDKWWFIVLLIVNTVGILELLYIFYFSDKNKRFTNQS